MGESTIWRMIEVIEKEYGRTIKGKEVRRMPEAQIKAIYFNMRNRQAKAKTPEHTMSYRCGTCAWWCDNKCNKCGYTRHASSLACRADYDDILEENHQMTLFEGGNGTC